MVGHSAMYNVYIHTYTRINPFARNIETHPYRVT